MAYVRISSAAIFWIGYGTAAAMLLCASTAGALCVVSDLPGALPVALEDRPTERALPMSEKFNPSGIRGILPTVLPPFDENEAVDVEALKAQVEYLVQGGVHGLVLMGSIGESPYLTESDRDAVTRTAVETVGGKIPVIVSIVAESTYVASLQLRRAYELGADAVQVCLPQYFRIEFEDVKQHFQTLSDLNLLPILYYHYPAATRLDLKPSQIAEVLAIPGMVGIKESTFDMLAIRRHIELTRGLDRIYLSGSELNFVQFMDLGGHGAVSAGSLVMPRTAVAMYQAYQAGDKAKASEHQSLMFETMPLVKDTSAPVSLARPAFLQAIRQGLDVPLGIESVQARLKAALARRGIPIRPVVRSPLRQLTPRDERAVDQAMKRIEQIEPAP